MSSREKGPDPARESVVRTGVAFGFLALLLFVGPLVLKSLGLLPQRVDNLRDYYTSKKTR